MRIVRTSLLFLIACLLVPNVTAEPGRCQAEDKAFRIGVLYQSSDARKRLYKGVIKALDDLQPVRTRLCLVDLHYTSHSEGLERMRRAIEEETVDVIIGPTESGIYLAGLREEEKLASHRVPVISPLVVAKAGNDPEGWFFRTNVDVTRRTQIIFDYMQKRWIRSTAVLYANTEFGRRAENAFREEILRRYGNTETYLPLMFSPGENARAQLDKILDTRPEAVGIFAEREDIIVLLRELRNMSQVNPPYEPFLFTVLDASQLKGYASGLYYVSVTRPAYLPTVENPEGEYDDVMALSYDTMALVVEVLDKMPALEQAGSRKEFRKRFRDQLVAMMSGNPREVGPKTGMLFSNFNNRSSRAIYHLGKAGIEPVNLYQNQDLGRKLLDKVHLVMSRFGMAPFLALLVMLVVVVMNSTWDLARWYEGSWWKVFGYWRTYLLFAMQFFLGAVIFIILAETGKVRYDSMAVAAVIGFAPSQFLRIKFFETRTGKDVGLVAFYDWVLSRLNDGMMINKYKDLQGLVEFVAHYNSEPGMVEELRAIYSHHINRTQRYRLEKELEEELREEKTSWERRKLCARELIKRLSLQDLQSRSLVPPDTRDFSDLQSPIKLIRRSWHYLLSRHDGHSIIDAVIEKEKKDWSKKEKEFYERKIAESDKDSDKLFSKVRFLVLKMNFNEEKLVSSGLLDVDYELPEIAEPDRQAGRVRKWLKQRYRQVKKDDTPGPG